MADDSGSDWQGLYEKYKTPQANQDSGQRKKLIAAALIVLSIAIAVYFLFNSNLFTPVADNPAEALSNILTSMDGYKLRVENGDMDMCIWARSMYDGSDYYVELLEYEAGSNCLGSEVNRTVFLTDGPVDLNGDSDCICNANNYLMEKNGKGNRTEITISKL